MILVAVEENPFFRDVLQDFLQKGNLSPSQVSYLDVLYESLDEEMKKIFVKGIKVNLRKNKNKEQIREIRGLKNNSLELVKLCMSNTQRKRYNLF